MDELMLCVYHGVVDIMGDDINDAPPAADHLTKNLTANDTTGNRGRLWNNVYTPIFIFVILFWDTNKINMPYISGYNKFLRKAV